jgi:hypothetical protein
MNINFNKIPGLSWNEWIKIPMNESLNRQDPARAKQKFIEDEHEYIQQIILQERIQQERQQTLQNQLRETVTHNAEVDYISSPGHGYGAGSAAASAGAGGFQFKTGWGNYVIGTYLDARKNPVDELVDEGYERWTIA